MDLRIDPPLQPLTIHNIAPLELHLAAGVSIPNRSAVLLIDTTMQVLDLFKTGFSYCQYLFTESIYKAAIFHPQLYVCLI